MNHDYFYAYLIFLCKKNFLTVSSPGDMDQTQIEPNLYLASVFAGMSFTLKVVGLGCYSDFFISLQFLSLIIISIAEVIIPFVFSNYKKNFI